jgi:L-2,4-diaminobutyrate decarboxylase
MNNNSDAFVQSLVVATERYLGASMIFMCLFGSRARQENTKQSDADIMVVTRGPIPLEVTTKLKEEISVLYVENDCVFDVDFPIEIIHTFDLQLALEGYGYVKQNTTIIAESIGRNDWSDFNSYRQWLAALATPNIFLAGDEKAYTKAAVAAQTTMLKLLLLTSGNESLKREDLAKRLISRGKEAYGFLDSTYTREYISKHYVPLLKNLQAEGLIKESGRIAIIDRHDLMPSGVKELSQYRAEKEYLGIHDTTSTITDHYQKIGTVTQQFISQPILNYLKASELASLSQEIGLQSSKTSAESLDAIVSYSIRQNHPRYAAFPDAGNSKAALFAAALEPILNQNMIAVDKSSPIGTFIEIDLIHLLRKLVGYGDAAEQSVFDIGGIATVGGVASNTAALLVARTKAFPSARTDGLSTHEAKPYLLISDETLEHYSHKASFWWLGLGENNVIPVASRNYDFDLIDLEKKLKKYNSNGKKVVAVIALAGDSRTNTIQNIGQIYALTQKYDTWLHVDACHGGVALFSSYRDELCADFKLADSMSIDPHKGLAIPYSSSFCLFKNPEDLATISKSTDITIVKGSFDIGQVTPFAGSRSFDSLKLWYTIKSQGIAKITEHVDYRIKLTKEWHRLVSGSAYFTSLHKPMLTALAFTIAPEKARVSVYEVSKLNKAIHDRAYQEGWFIIHCFDLIDYGQILQPGVNNRLISLGVNFGNIQLDVPMLKASLNYLESLAEEIIQQQRV